MTVLNCRASDEGRPIRNCLFPGRGGKIFASRQDWPCGADCTHRRHVNVSRSDGDERASRSCVCVDESVSRNFDLIQRIDDLCSRAEAPAVSVHVKNNRGSFAVLSRFHRAPHERQERRRNFAVQRDHDHISFVNRFTGGRRASDADDTSDTNADRAHLHVFN